MEYLGDCTLADLVRTKPDPVTALLLAEQVLRGLGTLHAAGVLHRDLKPENAMVDEQLQLRLIDFGLARPLFSTTARTVSMTGGLVGTPRYLSPEQIRDEKLTLAADLWSFGCVLYELLTGSPLFTSDNLMALGHEIMTREPPLDRPEVPTEIRDFLGRCLKRDLRERWQDAGKALAVFVPAAELARRRLCCERDAHRWQQVVDRGLLEKFAASHGGRQPADAAARFLERVQQQGIGELDEARVAEVLLAVFACQASVEEAGRVIQAARQKLPQDMPRLNADELIAAGTRLRELEQKQETLKKQVSEKVRELLKVETASWEERRQEEQWREQVRRQEEQKRDREKRNADRRRRRTQVTVAFSALIGFCGTTYALTLAPPVGILCLLLTTGFIGWIYAAYIGSPVASFTLKGHTNSVESVAISSDGKRIVSGSYDKTVKVWDAGSGQEQLSLTGHTSPVLSVAVSGDGKRIASGSKDGTVKLWDADTGQPAFTLKGHGGWISSVAYSPDGKHFVSGSGDQTLKVWDAVTGQQKLSLKGHTGKVLSVAYSPDGKRLASASRDQTVKVWNPATGREALSLTGHTDEVLSVAYSPDGKRLASGSTDQTVKVWDAAAGQEALSLKGHTGPVTSVAFSPDGKHIASGSNDQTVKVWDALSGKEILSLKGHTASVYSVCYSPDGKHIASGSKDGTVKVWDIDIRDGRDRP